MRKISPDKVNLLRLAYCSSGQQFLSSGMSNVKTRPPIIHFWFVAAESASQGQADGASHATWHSAGAWTLAERPQGPACVPQQWPLVEH